MARQVPDQMVAARREKGKRPDEGLRIVVGRAAAGGGLLVQPSLLVAVRRFEPIVPVAAALPALERDRRRPAARRDPAVP